MKLAVLALFLSLGLVACSAPVRETPETVCPYWIDGVIFVSSRMVDKNTYWLAKYRAGNANVDDLVKVIESNTRFHQGMVGRMEAAKEEAAAAREAMEDD